MQNIPEVFKENMTAEDFLINFYHALGWTPKKKLNPVHVVINREEWVTICDRLLKSDPNAVLLMLQYGPSGRYDVPRGKVRLDKGWLTD